MTVTDMHAVATSLTARAVYTRLLHNQPLFILDVRNPDDYGRWRIEGQTRLETLNIPYYDFIEDEDATVARLPKNREILVICAKEGSSQYIADMLRRHNLPATYLEGGINSWGQYYDLRDVIHESFGRIVQIARPARGDLSFAVISDGQAALIDPLRHMAIYRDAATEAGATITHIFDTHVHADHISGGPALAKETGAPYYVHAYDAIHPIDMLPARIDYTSLEDGQQFTVGQFSVNVIWYPGHTLGQVNYLFTAPDGQSYLFTGDGVFLRSFGRPDLGGKGEAWTPMLYESMFERLPKYITDATLILPAHFSALDEGTAEGVFAAPYGQVLQQNDALQPRSLEDFTTYVLSRLPVFPPEYVEIKRVNIGLVTPTEEQADELELGKNICALTK
jgi:glyoxylase-like metal-dependent hydrolase (beta-lactamase superfamily II)/rhodanese-related sulfurtransferase